MPEPAPGPLSLVLIPTALEKRCLDRLGGLPQAIGPSALCGFGPISAAARTAELLAALRPRRVLLLGIAGSFAPERLPLGSAASFARVRLDGLGAGSGAGFLPPSRLGFPQWEDAGLRIEESLPLHGLHDGPHDGPHDLPPDDPRAAPGELLTVCAASATPAEAAGRRERYPGAVAEDMEGFGVALACRLRGVPLLVVRGLANAVGEREPARWRVDEALSAARDLALACLAREPWTAPAVAG